MKKITVYLKNSEQILDLHESIITTQYSHILVKKANIFWSMYNVNKSLTTGLVLGGSVSSFEPGYYTFKDLQEKMPKGSILERLNDGKCRFTNNTDDGLIIHEEIKGVLGVSKDTLFLPKGVTTSGSRVEINRGLRYVKIHCDIVSTSNNVNERGNKDDTIVSLPITTSQPLFGSVQNFYDIESKVSIDKGVINQIKFYVTDQDNNPIDVGGILLELYLM